MIIFLITYERPNFSKVPAIIDVGNTDTYRERVATYGKNPALNTSLNCGIGLLNLISFCKVVCYIAKFLD